MQGIVREDSLFRLRFEHALGSDVHQVSRRSHVGVGFQAGVAVHDK